jgi:hypothetical protein
LQDNFHAGKYRVRFVGGTSQGFGESKQKGTPYFFATFEPIAFIADDGTEETGIPKDRRDVELYITENTADRVVNNLRSIGWKGSTFANLDPGVAGYHDLAGVEAVLECKLETYEGKERDKWEFPRPPRHSELGKDAKKSLDRLAGKALKSKAA